MPGLLVSVRSAEEALEAVRGGATVVDVKEPGRGPLGRASSDVVRLVREAVSPHLPVSVALGEMRDWEGGPMDDVGVSYRKLGLAEAGPGWARRWAEIRRSHPPGSGWVAVAYADWEIACSPPPDLVLDAALAAPDVVGLLVDTWDKTRPSPLDVTPGWKSWVDRARAGGRFVALAGGLDRAAIARLAPLRPDLFAVRGAACGRGDRLGMVEARRVARLVHAAGPGLR